MFNLSISYPQYSSHILFQPDFASRQLKIHQTGRSITILTARRARLELKRLKHVTCWLTMMINHPLDEAEDLIKEMRKYRSSLKVLEEKLLTNQHVEQEEFNYLTKGYVTLCKERLSALYKSLSYIMSVNRLRLNSIYNKVSQDILELDQIVMQLQNKYEGYLSGQVYSETLTRIYTFKFKEELRDIGYGDRVMTLDNRYIFYCDLDNPPFILWDITTRSVFKTFDREVRNIKKIVPAPNHRYIALATEYKFIVWYFIDDKIVEIDNPYAFGYILEITSDSKAIISISSKYICIWNLNSKRLINCIDTESSMMIYKSALSSNDEYLAISDIHNNIEVWSLKLNRRIKYIQVNDEGFEVLDIKFAYKDSYLIISYDCLIFIYNIKQKVFDKFLGPEYSSVEFKGVIQDRYIFYRGWGSKSYYNLWDLEQNRYVEIDLKDLSELEMFKGDSTVFFSRTHLYGLHLV